MHELVLYHTLGCHLCELAKEQVEPLLEYYRLVLKEVDIADDSALLERYGIRIPVIRLAGSSCELGWPFDSNDVHTFLEAALHSAPHPTTP